MKPRHQSSFRRTGSILAVVSIAMSLPAARAATQTWDNGSGDFTWNTTSSNWDGGSAWTNDNDAIFGASGVGTLTNAGVSAHNLTFSSSGYLIQDGTLTLVGSTPTITTDAEVDATINSTIAGEVGLVKSGSGTLTLGGANSYAGGTTINGGSVKPNNNAVFGSGPLTLSGCTLGLTADRTFANPVVVTAATTNTIGTAKLTGAITGSGTIYFNNTRGSFGNFGVTGDISGFTGTFWNDNSGNYMNGGFYDGATPACNDGSQAHFVTSGVSAKPGTSGWWQFLASESAGSVFKMGDLAGDGGRITGTLGMTFEIGYLNTDTTYAGSIGENAGTANVVKVGSGTLTLSGPNDYNGTTTVNGGRLVLQDVPAFTSAGIALTGGSLEVKRTDTGSSLATVISGDGPIEKTGPASLTLTGASPDYAGALTLAEGSLIVNGTLGNAASSVAVNSGTLGGNGTLGGAVTMANSTTLANDAGTGTLALDSLNFVGTGTVRAIPSATAAPLGVTQALTTAGGIGSITVELTSVPAANGVYHLIQFGTYAGAINHFKFPSLARSLSLQKNGNFIDVAVNSANQPVWTGARDGEWSTNPIGSPKNWKLSSDSSPTDFLNLDSVVFPSLASGYNIDVSVTDVAPAAMTFNNDSPHDYTLGGTMDITSGSLVKNGSGTLTISGVYTATAGYSFPGGATLNNGSVAIETETALGTGARTFNGGRLQFAGYDESWIRNTIVNDGGGTLDITSGAITHSGVISGSGSLTKTGDGTLTLATANSHEGGTTLAGGTVNTNNNAAFGSGPLTLSGCILALTADRTFANPVVVTAATTNTIGTAKLTGAITGSGTIYFNNTRGSFGNFGVTGDISGFTGTFWNDNSGNYMNGGFYDGATPACNDGSQAHFVTSGVSAKPGSTGWWQFLASAGAGSVFKMGDLAGDGGRITGTFGMTFEIGYLNTDTTYAGVIGENAGTANVVKVGSGTLTLTGPNDYNGTTTITQGALAVSNTTGSGTGSGAVTVQSAATLAGTGSISGNVTIESGGFVAPGNAAIGALTISAAALTGTYQCQLGAASGDQVVVTGELTVSPGAAISVSTLEAPAAASYTIATYGSLVGDAPAVTGIPAGYVLDLATPGQVNLVKSGGGYDTWADSFPGLTDKTPAGDPDKDGISNLLEYVIGGDPRVSSTAYLPSQKIVGTNLVLSYKRSDASEADTTQNGQWSSNLTDWTDIAPLLVNENDSAPDDMTISIPLSNAVGGKLFGRLQVTKP